MLKRFLRDTRGLSAVEFALISPLLVIFYFGTVEIDAMLTVDRRVTFTANVVADLVAQDDVVNQAELDAIFTAATAIMAPYDPDDEIRMIVTSVELNDDDDPVVVWSRGYNTEGYDADDDVDMPADIIPAGGSIIMAETQFDYQAPLAFYMDNAIRMSEVFYLRPRRSDSVCLSDGGATIC